MADSPAITTIDEYIAQFSGAVREKMVEIRGVIAAAAPEATEKISYGMPTYYLHGNLVHFGAAATHLGFYPGADGVSHFLPRLDAYKTSKGTIQFPLADDLPVDLIRDIVTFRVEQNMAKATQKKKKKA